jgi:hypothetical protein
MMGQHTLRKTQIKDILLDYLVPRLDDKEWLLLDDESLVKVRDETMFGMGAQRSDFGPSFVFWVFIRPLYWPPAHYAAGITARIGSWCRPRERLGEGWVDLGSPELAEHTAGRLAPVINARVAPWLAQFPDGKSVLQYASSWSHPADPVFGWIRDGGQFVSDLYALMWAWSGDRRKAKASLRGAVTEIRHNRAQIQRKIARLRGKRSPTRDEAATEQESKQYWEQRVAYLQRALDLLERPDELQAHLQAMADKNRAELKLDRAQSVLEWLRRRRRQGGSL